MMIVETKKTYESKKSSWTVLDCILYQNEVIKLDNNVQKGWFYIRSLFVLTLDKEI